ncbi:MAG: radical SAM protein [Thermodesulfobacteriota bacterium]
MKDQFHIQWHITNLCNLRCKHCYQEDFSKSSDLDWPGIKRVSDHLFTTLKQWEKTACIHLTGGEPLLKAELFPFLHHLDQQSFVEELGIISNGILLDREWVDRFSLFSKLKKIKVSLDGAEAETNDRIRQKEVFEKVVKSLSWLTREKRFEIILMFTVMKRNVKDLLSLFGLCKDLGIHGLIIERFIPLGRGKVIMNEVLSKDEWKEMVEMLLDFFSADGESQSFVSYQAFQIKFSGGESELLGAPCVIGVDGLCIMPEGSVYPCRRFPIPIGNLLHDSLKTIWENSEILEMLRKKENLKGKCGSCEVKECRGCRSLALAFTGDYLEEDPNCWYYDV